MLSCTPNNLVFCKKVVLETAVHVDSLKSDPVFLPAGFFIGKIAVPYVRLENQDVSFLDFDESVGRGIEIAFSVRDV